ncbi:MAG TPA: ribonuclease H-like domain-containing protein [Bacillota bacterium]|nr:ribonuclease H-like domain-containing protein [Bacillota bacterium]
MRPSFALKINSCVNIQTIVVKDEERNNGFGPYRFIESLADKVAYQFPDADLIFNNLQLIYGIGNATVLKLRESGFNTLQDLTTHPRWAKAALEVLNIIDKRDINRLSCYGATDWELLGFFSPQDIKFIDIETVGLYYAQPVFLIGILIFQDGVGRIRQYLARNYEEEKAILGELKADFRNTGIIASYNGRSFDVPYLKGRLRFHGLADQFDAYHLDLLRHTRKNYRHNLPDCRLTTVERYLLQEERPADLPGSEAPVYYHKYVDTGEEGYIIPILKHNAQDLLALAKLFGVLTANIQED